MTLLYACTALLVLAWLCAAHDDRGGPRRGGT